MEPEEACFPGFDEEDFTAPLTTKQARKEDIGLKKEEPLWFLEEDDEKLKAVIGDSKPRLEDTLLTRAAHYFMKKDYASSLVCWQKLDKLRNKPKEPRYEDVDGTCRCLFYLKRYEEAAESANKLVALTPTDAASWNLRGIVMSELSRTSDALASHLQAIACQIPAYRALLDAAEIYKSLNLLQPVKFLVLRYTRNARRSKLPGSATSPLELRCEVLRVWSELPSSATEDVSGDRPHSFPELSNLVALEVLVFGSDLSALSQRFSDEVEEVETESTEVRNPSRM